MAACRARAISTDNLLRIPFSVFLHPFGVTLKPDDGVQEYTSTVILWQTKRSKNWYLEEYQLDPELERQVKASARKHDKGRVDSQLVKLAALIAIYREGINPLEIRGMVSHVRGGGIYSHTRKAVDAFEQWVKIHG